MNEADTEQVEEASKSPAPTGDAAGNPAESPAQPDASEQSDTGRQIVEYLGTHCSAEELRDGIRALEKGIFVSENLVTRAITLYGEWLKAQTGSNTAPGDAKLVRKFFGDDEAPVYYLLDGKACIAGFLAPYPVKEHGKLPVQYFRGSLIEASNYLHLRDPILESTDNLKSVVDNQGFRLEIQAGKYLYSLDTQMVSKYAAVLRNIPALRKRYPAVVRGLRAALKPLIESLSNARLSTGKKPLIIPGRLRKDRNLKYLLSGEIVFIVDRSNKLLNCYGLRGKNSHEFFVAEFEDLKRSTRSKRIQAFQFDQRSRRSLGTVKVDDNRLAIDPAAFRQFAIDAPMCRGWRKKMKGHYTLRDLLSFLSDELTSAKRVEKRDLPPFLVSDAGKDTRFYLSDEFVFLFTPRSLVFSIVARFSKRKRPPLKSPESGGGKRKGRSDDSRRRRGKRTKKAERRSSNTSPQQKADVSGQ